MTCRRIARILRFSCSNPGIDYFTGPGSRNPDGQPHARAQADWLPNETLVSFEDNVDFAYNDLSFSFVPTTTKLPVALTFNVESTLGWQTTTLKVTRGQQLSFSADGRWTVDHRYFSYVGPDGYSPAEDSQIYQGCKLNPQLPYAKLLARVGDSPSFEVIGSGGTFTADRDGYLAFRIHDADTCLVDNAGMVLVTMTGLDPASVETDPPFYCIYTPQSGGRCQDAYKTPTPSPIDEPPEMVQLLNSPKVAPCMISVLSGLADLAKAQKVPVLQQGVAVLWLVARLANVPGFFEDYFNLIITLENSGYTSEDLEYWLAWTQGVVGILVKIGVNEATFKDCQTLWTNPPPVE